MIERMDWSVPHAPQWDSIEPSAPVWEQLRRHFEAYPETLEWTRIHLELAAIDAKAGRLDGLIGHHRALAQLGIYGADAAICESFRALGALLCQSGYVWLGTTAMNVARRVENHVREGLPPGAWATTTRPKAPRSAS